MNVYLRKWPVVSSFPDTRFTQIVAPFYMYVYNSTRHYLNKFQGELVQLVYWWNL